MLISNVKKLKPICFLQALILHVKSLGTEMPHSTFMGSTFMSSNHKAPRLEIYIRIRSQLPPFERNICSYQSS